MVVLWELCSHAQFEQHYWSGSSRLILPPPQIW